MRPLAWCTVVYVFDVREWRHVVTVTLAALAFALAACGGDDGGEPEASDVPDGAVAVVGDEEISADRLRREFAALQRAQSRNAKPARAQLENQALSQLLLRESIAREAAQLDVEVTAAEVRRRFAAAKRQFPSKRAYRRFLGKQSEADLRRQLHDQMLTEAVLEQIAGEGGDQTKALRRLQRKWSAETACAEGNLVSGCGNRDK